MNYAKLEGIWLGHFLIFAAGNDPASIHDRLYEFLSVNEFMRYVKIYSPAFFGNHLPLACMLRKPVPQQEPNESTYPRDGPPYLF